MARLDWRILSVDDASHRLLLMLGPSCCSVKGRCVSCTQGTHKRRRSMAWNQGKDIGPEVGSGHKLDQHRYGECAETIREASADTQVKAGLMAHFENC